MKRIAYLGMSAAALMFVSCGGETPEGENNGTDSTGTEVVEVEKTVNTFTIDTSASTLNWKGYESPTSEESYHFGTVAISGGTFEITSEGDNHMVTAGELTVDMNRIESGEELEKLVGHLNSADFFNVAEYTTATFTVSGQDGEMLTGTLNLLGTDLNVEAPVSIDVTEGIATVSVSDFRVDVTPLNMPFFVEDAKAPAEEQHDPKIGVNATIVGM